MKITFFGTTTLLFDDGRDQVLFDAHITRPSFWRYVFNIRTGTDTALCDKLIDLHQIDRLRAIFVSHTHHDHVMDAPYFANKCGADIYGSRSTKNIALGGGVPRERITVFRDGCEYRIGHYRIRVIRSLHSKPNILNNDLGIPVKRPLRQPFRLRDCKEGGSYDFFIEHQDRKILIRPSFNYIKGQLDDIRADILFLGTGGLGGADDDMQARFFAETVEKTGAHTVIPIHWDNFFSSLEKPVTGMPGMIEKTEVAFHKLAGYCEAHHVNLLIQMPRTSIEI